VHTLARRSLLPLALALAACGPGEAGGGAPSVERGRAVYLAVCTACHNADPARDGVQGPAVAGASRELLEARLLRGVYPPGYRPKRDTALMPRFPQLAGQLDDLHDFLAAAAAPAASE
jgi:mono/diheme cytochrome c family protein